MSWFNLNDSLNSIKGQISSLASEVLADGNANDADPSKTKIEELQNLVTNQETEIRLLQRQNEDLQEKVLQNRRPLVKENEAGNDDGWSWDPPDPGENAGRNVAELTRRIDSLESEKRDLISSLEQLDQDCQQTTDKLVTIKDELQSEHNRLLREHDDVKKRNELLLKINEENQKKIKALEASKGDVEVLDEVNVLRKRVEELTVANDLLEEKQANPEDFARLESILQEYENRVVCYEQELSALRLSNENGHPKLQKENEELKSELTGVKSMLEELDGVVEKLKTEINVLKATPDDTHKRYVEILQASISKCTDQEVKSVIGADKLTEFTSIVESIAELVLDHKWKCETLDKEVLDLTDEKRHILTEKNHEIEKLIRNSEELSNEIILKGQDLKHYEDECAELIKNNEMLISRLDEMKNISGLQTIPETNEDNMLILENQLDKSNKRVEELENMIADIESNKQTSSVDAESELEYVKNQLNMTGEELTVAKKEYQTLSSDYKQLATDNDSLKSNLEDMRYNYKECYTEMEGTEFKYAEQNINLETLKEEVETHLKTIEDLTRENKKLRIVRDDVEGKNELVMKEVDDLKQELTLELEGSQQKDLQIQNLIELLRNYETVESGLKMQLDAADVKIRKLRTEVENCAKNLNDSQVTNQIIIDENKALKEMVKQISQSDELTRLQSELKENAINFQALLVEKNSQSNELSRLQNELQESEKRFQALLIEKDSQSNELLHLQNELQENEKQIQVILKETNSKPNELLRLQNQLDESEKHLQTLSSEKTSVSDQLTQTKSVLKEKVDYIQALLKENKELNAENNLRSDEIFALKENANRTQTLLVERNLLSDELSRVENVLKENTNLSVEKESLSDELTRVQEALNEKEKCIQELLVEKNLLTNEILRAQNVAKEHENILNEKNLVSDELFHVKNALKDKEDYIRNVLTENNSQAKGDLPAELHDYTEAIDDLKSQLETISEEKQRLQSDFENFKTSVAENNRPNDDTQRIAALEAQIEEANASKNEMIALIKVKHEENVNYHLEIQKLHQALSAQSEKSRIFEGQLQDLNATSVSAEELARKDDAIEKLTDQNSFLREKCSVLAENLLQEQANVQKVITERSESSDRELALQKKLDNLRNHLIAVEESYTKEVQLAEQRCEQAQAKLQEVEQREKHSSNRYTSVNIRANQQVETLQTQMQLITNQRDEMKKRLSDYEDEVAKQKAALTNLHIVLQQFQRDKDYDIHNETERMNRQFQVEKQTQDALKREIGDLKAQLEESKQGLKAAVRLSDQVDASKRQLASMKEEVAKLQHQLERSEEKYNKYISQTDGKVDKMLIKNLIIGLVSSNNNLSKDQNQILKIISTVLDFNQQDIEKVKLNRNEEHSWFGSLLHPQALGGQNMTQESLSLAFVKFLEAESKPRELPNLLETASVVTADSRRSGSSTSSSVRQSPILLNEIVLPTFADFRQSRNSSSILKDVLKDPTNS